MSIDKNDPRLTAYALDELDERERREVETLLADSPEARKAVEEIRQTAGWIESELKSEPVASLTSQQRKTIETAMYAKRVSRWVPIAAAACLFLVAGVFGVYFVAERSRGKLILGNVSTNSRGVSQPSTLTNPSNSTTPTGGQVVLSTKDKEVLESIGYVSPGNNSNAAPSTPYSVNDLTITVPSFRGRQINLDHIGQASGEQGSSASVPSEIDSHLVKAAPEDEKRNNPDVNGDGYVVFSRGVGRSGAARRAEPHGTGYRLSLGMGATRSTEAPNSVSPSEGSYQLLSKKGTDIFRFDPTGNENYASVNDNPFAVVTQSPLSTFSIDVDTAAYSNMRRFITGGQLPPPDAVRIEEMINYFTYDYPQPTGDDPFSVNVEVAGCPWETTHQLLRVGLKGKTFADEARPASNLVFLIDVSGSMEPENKLPLLKKAMGMLTSQLRAQDRVAIVVYAGASGLVLPSTTCNNQQTIAHALDNLNAGGSTNGGAGIELAYQQATENFIQGGVNRVILATDGDFNVGITDQNSLVHLIEQKAKTGVFLSVLGFGMGNLKDATLEKLADKGNGNYAYIDTLNEAKKVLVDQMGGTLVTIAKDVKIQIEFNPSKVQAYRLIGYENRILAAQDFNDDRKDAGEIGAGHTVTALYELVPPGVNMAGVNPLKYQPQTTTTAAPVVANSSNEMLTVKLRYKKPDGQTSKLIERPVAGETKNFSASSSDFRFAAAVASFGMLLRHSPHSGNASFDTVLEMAGANLGADLNGYRAEFVELVRRAKTLRPN